MTYWFKRRRYGWGWTPATWQGWSLTLAMVVLIVLPAILAGQYGSRGHSVAYIVYVIVVIVVFIVIVEAKSPAPRWRWGKSAEDDPDKDF